MQEFVEEHDHKVEQVLPVSGRAPFQLLLKRPHERVQCLHHLQSAHASVLAESRRVLQLTPGVYAKQLYYHRDFVRTHAPVVVPVSV